MNLNTQEVNIFKEFSSPVTDPTICLNKENVDYDYFYTKENGDYNMLAKVFRIQTIAMFDWELHVYNKLREFKISPALCQIVKRNHASQIWMIYNMKNAVSLRMFLQQQSEIIDNAFVNELLSFVANLTKTYCFIHGSLSIDNMFVNKSKNNVKFYLIEFTHSIINHNPFKSNNVLNLTDLNSICTSLTRAFPGKSFVSYLRNNLPGSSFELEIIDDYLAGDDSSDIELMQFSSYT